MQLEQSIVYPVIDILLAVHQEIDSFLWNDPEQAFEPITLMQQDKPITSLDKYAEMRVAEQLRCSCRHLNPLIIGEESLRTHSSTLSRHRGLVFLLDILDGTRLCQFGLPDWCSAVVCFHPASGQIVVAVVMLPTGVAYFASAEGAGKARRGPDGALEFATVSGPSSERRAAEASIAFYGYNARRFVAMRDRFPHWTDPDVFSSGSNPNIFTVGGNPALVHMIDGYRKIDAVIEPFGQMPHDMLAGAYICHQAGGFLIDDLGQALDLESLLMAGLTSKIKYIAAATPELAAKLQAELVSVVPKRGMVRETRSSHWQIAFKQ